VPEIFHESCCGGKKTKEKRTIRVAVKKKVEASPNLGLTKQKNTMLRDKTKELDQTTEKREGVSSRNSSTKGLPGKEVGAAGIKKGRLKRENWHQEGARRGARKMFKFYSKGRFQDEKGKQKSSPQDSGRRRGKSTEK